MFYGLELNSLRKSYSGTEVVKNVSLKVPQGEFVCFLGPSGCGKTTLLRMIAGLEETTSGSISYNSKEITKTPVHQRNFAMVFQSLALYPHMNVANNISYSLKLRGVLPSERKQKAEQLLELIQLPNIGERSVDELSGGQRQRVAIARALAQEPLIFLMDEPLSALDAQLRDHMQVELRQLQQKLKITTIFVTHDQREAMSIADTIVVMGDGVIQQVGSPQEVYRRPANRFVASFIGQSNLFSASVLGSNELELFGRGVTHREIPESWLVGEACTLLVRPEHIELCEPGQGWPATVEFIRDMGSSLELRLRHQSGMEIIATTSSVDKALQLGDLVGFGFDAQHSVVLESEEAAYGG